MAGGGFRSPMSMGRGRQNVPSVGGKHPGSNFLSPMKGGAGPAGLHYLTPSARGGMGLGFTAGDFVPGKGDTDTVPAMLTPGEFVIKKKSAQAHKKLIKRINDSDGGPIKGA